VVKFLIGECLSLDLVDLARDRVSRKAPTLFAWAKRKHSAVMVTKEFFYRPRRGLKTVLLCE
jgi:hypothetical protein